MTSTRCGGTIGHARAQTKKGDTARGRETCGFSRRGAHPPHNRLRIPRAKRYAGKRFQAAIFGNKRVFKFRPKTPRNTGAACRHPAERQKKNTLHTHRFVAHPTGFGGACARTAKPAPRGVAAFKEAMLDMLGKLPLG